MAIVIDGIVLNADQLLRVRALFGTVEKMKTNPNWIEAHQKYVYLTNLIESIKIGIQMDIDRTSPFNLYRRLIVNPLGKKMAYKFIIPGVERICERYRNLLSLPVGFVLGAANEEFDTWMDNNRNFVRSLNKTLNIKDDIYV